MKKQWAVAGAIILGAFGGTWLKAEESALATDRLTQLEQR